MSEAHGMPRMAGRILGRLLMCTPAHQSLRCLAEDVQASKGSVSTMTRLLIERGIIERVTFPGDRHDYVRVRSGSIGEMFTHTIRHADMQARLLERALAVADDPSDEGLARIREAHDFFTFMRDEFPSLLERWQVRRSQAGEEDPGAAPPRREDPPTHTKEVE